MRESFDVLVRLLEYEVWCSFRALEAVEALPADDCRRDFGFGWRTPHATMFHIADVMRGWGRTVGPAIEQPAWRPYDSSLPLQDIRTMLTDAATHLVAAVKASHEAGVLGEQRRLHQVFHVVTHGTHHRGQLLSMLTLMGRPQPFEGGDFGGWSKTRRVR